MINEEWHVERNNGIRQIVTHRTMKLIAHNLTKDLAFHITDLHNEWLKNQTQQKWQNETKNNY